MLEGYITPLLMSYIDKFIKNIKPSDLQVSFWGGDAVLRNLELRLDVLEKELNGFPVEIQSGKIREMSIHLPWNAIASTSVEITIQDLELVIKMKSMRSKSKKEKPSPTKTADTDNPVPLKKSISSGGLTDQPGYLQGYLTRIINNGKMHIKRMVIKVIEEESDLMLTFNIGSLEGYTTDENWEKTYVYTDYFKDNFSLYKECVISDMTVNLHPIEGLGDAPSKTTSHEPFVQRCSFTGRMKLDYRGNMFVKKSVEVLFDAVEFQVNENQFCLFMHILDWLLAAYYSTKRLKGDTPDSPLQLEPPPTSTPPSSEPPVDSQTVGSTSESGETEQPMSPSSKGWSSWMFSFVSSEEENNGSQGETASITESKHIVPSSTYAMSANTVSVTMNVTHKVQVPIFYSMRSFTSPVIHLHFTGCTNKLESVPQNKLFLYTLGIMSVEASITGLCPCVKKFPSSWRRTSTASIAETNEKIPIFSSGEHPLDSSTLSEEFLRGSLFDPTHSNSATIDLPPVTKEELARVGEAFQSLWISYLYFDVSASRVMEECFERVAVGRSKMAVSPDVVHRLQHFWTAYSQCMEAKPSSSKGKVVRGDPNAVTNFDIEFAGGHMIFTPNAHFIPTSLPDQSKHKSPKHHRKQQPTLPALCTTCDKLNIAILQPMYSRNASPDTPQKVHTEIQHDCIAAGVVMVKSLSDVLKEVSCDADVVLKQPKSFLHFGKCMDLPKFTSEYDSTNIGDNSLTTSTWDLCFNEATCVGTLKQLDHFLSISSAWFLGEPLSSRAEIMFPSKQPLPLNMQLHGVMRDLVFTRSFCDNYYSMSVVLSEASVAILKEGVKIPVFHGPLNTCDWNTIDSYTKETLAQNDSEEGGKDKLVEFFMATPYDKLKDEIFPVVKLEMSGCAMSLEPSLVEYMKFLPLNSLHVQAATPPIESHTTDIDPSPSTPHTLTSISSVESAVKVQEPEMWSMLKKYEVMVKTSPILMVLLSRESTSPPSDPSSFPLLPALAKQVGGDHSNKPNSALLISLPSMLLESARGGAIAGVVERDGRPDSLPWDCGLASLAVFTVMNEQSHYLLEPLAVKATLAPQQEGSGITVHSNTVTMALSKEQVELMCGRLADVAELANTLTHSFATSEKADEARDEDSVSGSLVDGQAPSHLSSPAQSTLTRSTTLPAGSDVSTVSSFLIYQGLSSLWIQVIIPKLVLNLYAWDHSGTKQTSDKESLKSLLNEKNGTLVKLSIEIDGTSLQVDIQEKCTDIVFKLAAMESSLYQKNDSLTNNDTTTFLPDNQWIPRITSSNGKIFSSLSSVLPESLSQETAATSPTILLPSQQHLSPSSSQSNFVLVTIKLPQGLPHKVVKLSCNVRPFEVCAWLPVLQYVLDIGSPVMATKTRKKQPSDKKDSSSLPLSLWPALDVHLENFRLVIPDSSYTNTLLLNTSSLHITSALDITSPDVRFVTDPSTFGKLARLSQEKQLPPLPLYQLDLIGVDLEALVQKDCVRSFLCTSTADLRVVYTPPLCLTPSTRHKEVVQATGHSLELNVITDATLFVGYDQVKCASDIFKTNNPFHAQAKDTTSPNQPAVANSKDKESSSLFAEFPPLKVLLTGKTVCISMLKHATSPNQPETQCRLVTPFVHAIAYNPFCTLQVYRGCIETELSCFNMAALYSEQPTPIAYSDLTSADSVSSLLESRLFTTARGQSVGGLPPILLSVSCSLGEGGNLSVDIRRPVKISLTPGFIERSVEFACELEEIIVPLLNGASDKVKNKKSSNDNQKSDENISNSSENKTTTSSLSKVLNSKVCISTSQMVFEFKLSTFSKARLISREQSVVSEDSVPQMQEDTATSDPYTHPSLKEGLLAGWEGIAITIPSKRQTGNLQVKGMQLLSVCAGVSSFIVAPVQLQCALKQHLYTHDLSQLSFEISCGLLEMFVSQASVSTILTATSLLSEVTKPLVSRFASTSSSSKPRHRRKEIKSSNKDVVSFCDDLRCGDFKYTIDVESEVPRMPVAGEIVFHLGDSSPMMTWCYQEPRALTHMTVLPLPFSVTSNTPIKVRCCLQYWRAEEHCFSTLTSFHISETTPSELTFHDLTSTSVDSCPSARVWRVVVKSVVGGDEDEVFHSKAEILDDAGSPLPLTAVLSPVSLAANLRINSIFSPSFIPSLTLSFSCKEFTGTLLHHNPVEGPVLFEEYRVAIGCGSQELLRVSVKDGIMVTNQERGGDISLKVDGVLSMEYVDFGDLVWRTTAYPTKLSGSVKYSQNIETSLDAPPDAKSLSVSLAFSPAILRLSQGLVHTSSLAAHVWLNSGLAGMTGSGCNHTDPASLLLNHYVICNDTMEDLHIRQFSTDEDRVICNGECTGYSWRSHVISPRQLQLCVVMDEVQRWTEPFSVCGPGVHSLELDVGGHTAAVFVRVTQLGGLQKQVTLFGSWKLFSTLPFPIQVKLCSSHPDNEYKQGALQHKVLALDQDGSLPSIVGTEAEVDGVMFRTMDEGSWSKVYPMTCGQNCNRPQLLVEFPYGDGSFGYCWYNIKPIDYWNNKPWGSKISLSPLFAVRNLSPFDLTLTMNSSQSAPAHTPTPEPHSETLALGKGRNITLSLTYGADVVYNLTFKASESPESSSPPLVLSTHLLHDLPFIDSADNSGPPPTYLSVPLGTSGDFCTLQASFERNHLNTITVVLRPKAQLTNRTPCSVKVMGVVTGGEEETTSNNYEVAPQEEMVLINKEFVLSVDLNGVPLCSKPIALMSLTKVQGSKEIDQKLLHLTEVCSDSKEKMAAQFLLTTESQNPTTESTIRPAYVLHNKTKNSLWTKPIMIAGKVNQELLTNLHKNTCHHSFQVKQGKSEPIVFWNSINSQRKDQGALTQVVCLTAAEDKALITSSSIFLSPKFVRHSFSLPTINETTLSYRPHLLTRHEANGITYLVVSEDPSPRFYFQNMCATDLEVVEYGTAGVNAYPQSIPSGCEVVYEPPSIAKLYPLVFDAESTSDQEKELKEKADKAMLKMRQKSFGEEPFAWSKPFPLNSAEEKVVLIPNVDIVFISTDKRGCTTTMTIIPTTNAPLSNMDLPSDQKVPVSIDMKLTLEQIVVCIDDEVTDQSAIKELVRMYGDDIKMCYTMSHRKNTQIELSMLSCQIDNVYEKTSPEYAVAMISRCEHVRRRSLIQTEFPPVVRLQINFNPCSMRLIDKLQVSTQPVTIQLEDSLLQHMKDLIFTYIPPGILFLSSKDQQTDSSTQTTPTIVLQEADRDVSPLFIANLIIEPTSFFLSASITLKIFLSCNDTPFSFSEFHLHNIYSNSSEVLQLIGARYASSAFMNAAWMLGSLEIIGSPGTLIQSVGRGLRDLVILPYQGLSHSPGMFVLGLGQGTASFLQNCSSGALSSVTNLASSISRNMEQLSMDPDHASYQKQIRRQASVPKFSSGVRSGVSSFGLSLISAVAGIVDQPMQSFQRMEDDSSTLGATKSILAGVGKGILGVVTKPMGGAMELVSKTGQGIMHGTGLAKSLSHREVAEKVVGIGPICKQELPTTLIKCVRRLDESYVLCTIPITRVLKNSTLTQGYILIMTPNKLHFLDIQSDTIQQNIPIADTDVVTDVHSSQEGYVELHFKHCTHQMQTDSADRFHPVEHYLNLPQAVPFPMEQDFVDSSVSKQQHAENINNENNNNESDILYVTTEHNSEQFLSIYHHVRQEQLDQGSSFFLL